MYFGDTELQLVKEFKYLGVLLDYTLSFKSHIKMISRIIKFNVSNFNQFRRSMTDHAAMTFLHSMIFSHISYCITSWSLTGISILKPIERLYNRALKILDKKAFSYHHCKILTKYKLLSFENFIKFKNACLIYKTLHGIAPPPACFVLHQIQNKQLTDYQSNQSR